MQHAPRSPYSRPSLLLLAAVLLASCRAVPGLAGASYAIVDTQRGARVSFGDLVDALAGYDVVFLGEEHDNDVAHELQLRTTRALHERHPEMAVSLEQFERDVQDRLDAYLAGRLDERRFLEDSRPWGNYAEHYAPVVRWAKAAGVPVLAANIPRPLARRVSRQGAASVARSPNSPWRVTTDEPEYFERFAQAMGGQDAHDAGGLRLWYTAQCIKDDQMAESIAEYLAGAPPGERRVVHWCGRFHSDFRLGTVSRLAWRRPNLRIAVVSTVSTDRRGRALTDEERRLGDFVWLVPEMD